MQKYLIILTLHAYNSFFFNTFADDYYIINQNLLKKIIQVMLRKYILSACLIVSISQSALAQSGTNSPYSQFGLGLLSDHSTGFNRGMNGLGIAFHEHNQVNNINPASYASIDSLTFIFDAGVSGQITNFKENGRRLNAKNADFEYIVGAFRLHKHLGLSFGLIPYTNVGYSYSTSGNVGDIANTTFSNSFYGTGGLHQVYADIGWQPVKGLSVGMNGGYLYGDYTRTVVNSFSNSAANTLTKTYSADVRSYLLSFGAQYSLKLSKKDELNIGATFSPGHKIGGKPSLSIISTNTQTALSDTTRFPAAGQGNMQLEIPTSLAAGVMINHDNSLKLGVDYQLQRWASVEEPAFTVNSNGQASYALAKGNFMNRHKITIGSEYCPMELSRSFFKRMHYRAGISYATPYYKINNADGPREISASVGIGIPVINSWNNRSWLNIGAQWVRQSANHYITENTFRINIGLTFNERWFAKWKLE